VAYSVAVMAWLAKLLVLIGVLLMPFGMVAPAAAAPHHSAAMPMQHCPEQAPTHKGKLGFADCTMACAAALPAAEASPADEPPIDRGAQVSAAVRQLHGVQLEIATPPPKRS
jgi:hypothetical protein